VLREKKWKLKIKKKLFRFKKQQKEKRMNEKITQFHLFFSRSHCFSTHALLAWRNQSHNFHSWMSTTFIFSLSDCLPGGRKLAVKSLIKVARLSSTTSPIVCKFRSQVPNSFSMMLEIKNTREKLFKSNSRIFPSSFFGTLKWLLKKLPSRQERDKKM
jgi:hypothetical protein